MIISIGYRVKSQNGIIFRKWANKILKDYLIKGYVINKKRLEYLEKTVKYSSQKQIRYEDCIEVIKKLRFNEESDIFAIERKKSYN